MSEVRRRGRPPKQDDESTAYVRVRCLWPNVWTSAGKLMKGEEAEIPADEAAALDARDAIKVVRPE